MIIFTLAILYYYASYSENCIVIKCFKKAYIFIVHINVIHEISVYNIGKIYIANY